MGDTTIIQSVSAILNESKAAEVAKRSLELAAQAEPGSIDYHMWMDGHHRNAAEVHRKNNDVEQMNFHHTQMEGHTKKMHALAKASREAGNPVHH